VELLVAMMILALLAGMVLFTMSMAQEAAKAAKTKAMIKAMHSVIMERWESYLNRRMPLNMGTETGPEEMAAQRLAMLREIMLRELPERWIEVSPQPADPKHRTDLQNAYVTAWKAKMTNQYQGAECLYLIMSWGMFDAQGRAVFTESDIGDVDDDSAPEILDGWGKPISFLRWAAGFLGPSVSALQSGDPVLDHDPFDPYLIDPTAYRLVPLIYSAGPDGEYGIYSDNDSSGTYTPFDYRYRNRQGSDVRDPFDPTNHSTPHLIGSRRTDFPAYAIDDIHNHMDQ